MSNRTKRIEIARSNQSLVKYDIPVTYNIPVNPKVLSEWFERHPTEKMPTIEMVKGTTCQAIRHYISTGHKPIALNFANAIHAGGGYINGAMAQEEELCRTAPNLYPSLKNAEYPFRWTHDIRFTPKVKFLRKDGIESNGEYDMLDKKDVYDCPIITAAAPNLNTDKQMIQIFENNPDVVMDQLEWVIRTIIMSPKIMSMQNGYGEINDVLIVGALGCGAFRPQNIPHNWSDYSTKIAQIFLKAITEQNGIRGMYKKICFAIPGDDNFDQFCKVFNRSNIINLIN